MPQSPTPEQPQPTPRRGWSLLYLLLFLGTLLVFSYLFTTPPSTVVPYSQFMEAVGDGRVEDVVIAEDYVAWTEPIGTVSACAAAG